MLDFSHARQNYKFLEGKSFHTILIDTQDRCPNSKHSNIFKPSSSKASQDENDSEGTATASTSSTSGERKRKQQAAAAAAAAVEAQKVISATLKSFPKEWLKEFAWLEEIQSQDGTVLMKCKSCTFGNEMNTFTKGYGDFQKSALKRHDSQSANDAWPNGKGQEGDRNARTVMMRTVYYLAKNSQ